MTTEKVPFTERTKVFFAEVRTEMSKVDWPTNEQVKNYTIVVLAFTAIASALIAVWDLGLGWFVDRLFQLHS